MDKYYSLEDTLYNQIYIIRLFCTGRYLTGNKIDFVIIKNNVIKSCVFLSVAEDCEKNYYYYFIYIR